MASLADSKSLTSTNGSSPAQKYVPRFKRDPTAVSSSIVLYTHHDIAKKIGGESDHTFCRSHASHTPLEPSGQTAPNTTTFTKPTEDSQLADAHVARPAPSHQLAEEFSRIMIHKYAHLTPPRELWTRNNIAQLDVNVGRPLPVFQEVTLNKFEFLGWYKITAWELCPGGGTAVQTFVRRRKVSQRDRTAEYWAKALGQDWGRVQLERVRGMTVNPMQAEA